MRALVLIHRWLCIPLCLFFAMWFATGVVMHFVPFPALTEAERFAGLARIDPTRVKHSPADAVAASKLTNVVRVRLWQRSDGPVFLVSSNSSIEAFHSDDLRSAALDASSLALVIAKDHARRRGIDTTQANFVELGDYDQWTVPNGLDQHRPLYRVALNDPAGTELYVSSATGEVVRDTTRTERAWNYVGSVLHWIYPTVLRKDWRVWNEVVWWLSLLAMVAVMTGIVLGSFRLKLRGGRLASPFRHWHAWHHWLGMGAMIFVSTWIFSGWLSMDHGRLFSEGQATEAEAHKIMGAPKWSTLRSLEFTRVSAQAREIEWFALGGEIFRREWTGLDAQNLFRAGTNGDLPQPEFLQPAEVSAVTRTLGSACIGATAVPFGDNYALEPSMPSAPIYRTICGEVWFHVDGASGAILEKLDPSRRAYRWLYSALHTFDLPVLMARPTLRTMLIMLLCGFGFTFSMTGVVIAWRRLKMTFQRPSMRRKLAQSPEPRDQSHFYAMRRRSR